MQNISIHLTYYRNTELIVVRDGYRDEILNWAKSLTYQCPHSFFVLFLGTWFSDSLTVGLHDLEDLFPPK